MLSVKIKYGLIFLMFALASISYGAEINKNEINVTLQYSRISLDPGGIQDSQSWFVSRQINCQLVRNQGGVYVLDAAQSIKYINPSKIILKIKNGAIFHDGTPVTAYDVIASFNYIKKSRNILGNLFNWIDEIQVINDKTMLFSLKHPVPQFLNVLSSTRYTIFIAI